MPEATSTNKEHAEPKATAPVKAPAPEQDVAPDVPVADLIAKADQFLGVPSYVAAGALFNESGDMSIDAAKTACEAFLAREVTKEG